MSGAIGFPSQHYWHGEGRMDDPRKCRADWYYTRGSLLRLDWDAC